jgi:hypothetical protein
MPTDRESSMTPRTSKYCLVMEEKTWPHSWPSRKVFKPWAPWVIGLAFVVTLWGFGYKVSRYYPHLDAATRASFSKLWDEHLDVALIARITRTIAKLQRFSNLDADFLVLQDISQCRNSSYRSSEYKCIPSSLHSPVILRSPPFAYA